MKASLTIEAIARLGITIAVVLLVILPIGSKVYGAFFSSDKRFLESFVQFTSNINDMKEGSETFTIKLKKGSAIIGFSQENDEYKYITSSTRTIEHGQLRIDSVFKKPSNEECDNNACICLCSDSLDWDNNILKCKKQMYCEKLENVDIINSLPILFNPFSNVQQGDFKYWKGGFLFGRNIKPIYNGLTENKNELEDLRIEKRRIGDKNIISFCDFDMFKDILVIDNYRQKFFGDKCIVTEFDEAKQFEFLGKNPEYERTSGTKYNLDVLFMYKNAIDKYEQFIEKYKIGREVEKAKSILHFIDITLQSQRGSGNLITQISPETRSFIDKTRSEKNLEIIPKFGMLTKSANTDFKPKRVVLHHTGGDTLSGAENILRERNLGVHFIIDKEGKVFQYGNLIDMMFHSCGSNHETLGVEIVNNGYQPYTEDQYASIRILKDQLKLELLEIGKMNNFDISEPFVIGHFEVDDYYQSRFERYACANGKWDPSPNFDWSKIEIQHDLTSLKNLCIGIENTQEWIDSGENCYIG